MITPKSPRIGRGKVREFRSPIHHDNKGGKNKKIKGKSKGKNAKLKAVRTRVSSQTNEVKLFDQNRGQRVSRGKEKEKKDHFSKDLFMFH